MARNLGGANRQNSAMLLRAASPRVWQLLVKRTADGMAAQPAAGMAAELLTSAMFYRFRGPKKCKNFGEGGPNGQQPA